MDVRPPGDWITPVKTWVWLCSGRNIAPRLFSMKDFICLTPLSHQGHTFYRLTHFQLIFFPAPRANPPACATKYSFELHSNETCGIHLKGSIGNKYLKISPFSELQPEELILWFLLAYFETFVCSLHCLHSPKLPLPSIRVSKSNVCFHSSGFSVVR